MKNLFDEEVIESRKNFSRNNLGQRRAGDFYQTPPSIVEQLLEVLPVKKFPILEPAEGHGALSTVLRRLYSCRNVIAYDIIDGRDFLEETDTFPEIITNPPFSLSTEFIIKCKEVATRRFSLLMPIDYLHGLERFQRIYSVHDEWSLAYLHIFVRRAMMTDTISSDGKYDTGMITWGWYTWLREMIEDPKIRWIDNQKYVRSKEAPR